MAQDHQHSYGAEANLPAIRPERRQFDTWPRLQHPREVRIFIRRLSVVILTMGLLAGNAAVCAGWLATPEARMACCAEGRDCPMHKGESQRSGRERLLTQAQVDSCCASSERENSSQSTP